jgi:hypothetical protein
VCRLLCRLDQGVRRKPLKLLREVSTVQYALEYQLKALRSDSELPAGRARVSRAIRAGSWARDDLEAPRFFGDGPREVLISDSNINNSSSNSSGGNSNDSDSDGGDRDSSWEEADERR